MILVWPAMIWYGLEWSGMAPRLQPWVSHNFDVPVCYSQGNKIGRLIMYEIYQAIFKRVFWTLDRKVYFYIGT
jgi:hypothetical protein